MNALAPPSRASAPIHGPQLDPAAFDCIAGLAYREAGLFIPQAKSAMVRTRLARRLRALKLPDFGAYCDLVESPDGHAELAAMISALTTNVSHFFREEHHFDILRRSLMPRLREKARAGQRIRIWSAGCSNGQEPYSIAMTLRDAGLAPQADVRILATDIDPVVVAHARAGRYDETMMAGLPEDLRNRFFTPPEETGESGWRIAPELGRMVVFRELNLLRDWPMRGFFDAIFCRNVVIYFDGDTQSNLWPRFAGQLEPEGWLFLGHSERVSESGLPYFESRGMTSYQRNARPVPFVSSPGRNKLD